MSRRFLDLPPHKSGYCWRNVAPLGEKPVWEEHVATWAIACDGTLFGYEEKEFMAKQYKRVA